MPCETLMDMDVLKVKHLLAMDNDRPVLSVGMVVHHIANTSTKLEQSIGKRVRMARPFRVMEQYHFAHLTILNQRQIMT